MLPPMRGDFLVDADAGLFSEGAFLADAHFFPILTVFDVVELIIIYLQYFF